LEEKWTGAHPMNTTELKEVLTEQLKDIYSAEKQLVKALPKMAKAASTDELSNGFEEHLEQTKGHVQRLETIFEEMEESPKGPTCKGMEGLIEESSEVIDDDELEGESKDLALIAAAQRVEHYEIAAYGCVRAFAGQLGMDDAVSLLEQTLEEEKETDQKLNQVSETLLENVQDEGEGEEQQTRPRRPRTKAARA
jgi:ferritin-like metal-binding protein YciE